MPDGQDVFTGTCTCCGKDLTRWTLTHHPCGIWLRCGDCGHINWLTPETSVQDSGQGGAA